MKKLVLAAIVSAALIASVAFAVAGQTAPSQLPGQRGTLWVVNKPRNEVAAFDGKTGALLGTVPVGRSPNSVVVAAQKAKAYVTNEDSNDVTVISTMTRTAIATIPVGPDPHHIRTSLDGSRVYVTEYATNRVAVIDTATDKVVSEFTTSTDPNAKTHSVWITPDRKTLWVANEVASTVTGLDAATGAIEFTVPVVIRPSEVLVSPNGQKAYVTNRSTKNEVTRIDVATRAVDAEVAIPAQPDTLQLSPDGKLLDVALRGTPAQLAVVDTTTMTLAKVIDIAGLGTIAAHNWLSANGRYAFVSYEGGDAPGIAVVDHRTNEVVSRIDYPGGGRPHGVYYDDPASTEGPAVVLGPAKLRVSRAGTVALRVTCSADAVGSCKGTVSLAGGKAAFSLAAGATTTVRLRVRATAKKVVVKASAIDLLGNTRTSARAVTLVRRS